MHGGKREGAGRKPGVPNIRTEAQTQAAEEGGIMPLDYMLRVMRDETQDVDRRMDAAKGAAPYVHAKLANVTARVEGKDGGPIVFTWQPS